MRKDASCPDQTTYAEPRRLPGLYCRYGSVVTGNDDRAVACFISVLPFLFCLHSYLSAISGSTFVARRAGIQHASNATKIKGPNIHLGTFTGISCSAGTPPG
jgi:hypothetical protein